MPSRSFRNKNPGNIMVPAGVPWEQTYACRSGATGVNDGYAVYPTVIRGLAAMVRLLSGPGYVDLALLEAIKKYAPQRHGNRPEEYADYVAHRAGVPQNMRLADMDIFQTLRMVEAMIRFEGWHV